MTYTKSNASKKGLGFLIAVAALLVAFAVPVSASAQSCSPTDSQYAPPSAAIDCSPTSGGGGGGDGGTLPFTGIDLVPLAAIALALGGTGLMIRRYGTGDSEKV